MVGQSLRDKHFDTLGKMQSSVINLDKPTWEGGEELRQMKEMRDDLKALAKGEASRVRVQQEEK